MLKSNIESRIFDLSPKEFIDKVNRNCQFTIDYKEFYEDETPKAEIHTVNYWVKQIKLGNELPVPWLNYANDHIQDKFSFGYEELCLCLALQSLNVEFVPVEITRYKKDYWEENRDRLIVSYYNCGWYHLINPYLRGAETDRDKIKKIQLIVETIDNVIARSEKSKSKEVVFRGLHFDKTEYDKFTDDLIVGNEVKYDGYFSTTRSLEIAEYFLSENRDPSYIAHPILMIVTIPKGARYLNMKEFLKIHTGEEELLLPSGSRFNVSRVYKKSNITICELEYILNSGVDEDTSYNYTNVKRSDMRSYSLIDGLIK